MAFYTYHQNNSGGSWDVDKAAGIGSYVIVEAASAAKADGIAKAIGLYFDSVENDVDCDCCGDRWYEQWGEGSEIPQIHGEDVSGGTYLNEWWAYDKKELPAFIHYADGTVKTVEIGKKPRLDE